MLHFNVTTTMHANLKLACTDTFNPAEFIGKDWRVWRGPADGGGLEGEEDRDFREDEITMIDWNQIIFETNLSEGEKCINGEEKLRRLAGGENIRLGCRVLLSLWKNYLSKRDKGKIHESVLEQLLLRDINFIAFFGLILRNPYGGRDVLYLYRDYSGWRWRHYWLNLFWYAYYPSASFSCSEPSANPAL